MKHLLFFLLIFSAVNVWSQSIIPAAMLKSSDTKKPQIFFISGDGGWKGFATSLAQTLNSKGFPIIGIDAKAYFWTRKTPEQTAADLSSLIAHYLNDSKNKSFILMGYSFGADVVPFIQSRLQKEVASCLVHTFLLSPSPKTDFEVHVLEMLGINNSYGRSVEEEIYKLTSPITVIFGRNDTNHLVINKKTTNLHTVLIPGNHHFNNNVDLLVNTIIPDIK